MFLLLCLVHGLQFITIRTTGELQERARRVGKRLAPITLLLVIAFFIIGAIKTDIFTYHGNGWILLPILATVALVVAALLNSNKRTGCAFAMTSFTIILLTASIFIGMFPRVMISSISEAYDLTIYTTASGDYELRLMFYLSFGLFPFFVGFLVL